MSIKYNSKQLITPPGEVVIHATAADLEFTMVRNGIPIWELTVCAPIGIEEKDGKDTRTIKKFMLDAEQACAVMALFVDGDKLEEKLMHQLYEIAEPVFVNENSTSPFRIIP